MKAFKAIISLFSVLSFILIPVNTFAGQVAPKITDTEIPSACIGQAYEVFNFNVDKGSALVVSSIKKEFQNENGFFISPANPIYRIFNINTGNSISLNNAYEVVPNDESLLGKYYVLIFSVDSNNKTTNYTLNVPIEFNIEKCASSGGGGSRPTAESPAPIDFKASIVDEEIEFTWAVNEDERVNGEYYLFGSNNEEDLETNSLAGDLIKGCFADSSANSFNTPEQDLGKYCYIIDSSSTLPETGKILISQEVANEYTYFNLKFKKSRGGSVRGQSYISQYSETPVSLTEKLILQ